MAINLTRYAVSVENAPVRHYDTPTEAVAAARAWVYLASERESDMLALLQARQIAEWQYGFSGVTIYPPTRCDHACTTPEDGWEVCDACGERTCRIE
jgi:hypothetical protein